MKYIIKAFGVLTVLCLLGVFISIIIFAWSDNYQFWSKTTITFLFGGMFMGVIAVTLMTLEEK